MENMINKAKTDAAQMIKEVRDQAKLDAKKEAQRITIQAIQRTAVDHSVESTVSVVQIQNDEMKGRIIGREGRNIRAFEAVTGVDVIVDDTPEAVILSSFDQFRREIARVSLERLIADGRIHPARIEEVHHAEEEGVIFNILTNPTKIIGNDENWVTAMECLKYELGEPDESGRRKPVAIKGSEFIMDMDTVVVAIGQGPNPLVPRTTKGLETNKKGNIMASEETGATSKPRCYAGGDVVTGAATVIKAMGAGRVAATNICELLKNS